MNITCIFYKFVYIKILHECVKYQLAIKTITILFFLNKARTSILNKITLHNFNKNLEETS